MTTAWSCAPCQRMRRRQITQWSGSRACNLLAKIQFRCGWLRWRAWDCAGALLGCSAADPVAAPRAPTSQAVSARCHCNQNFCPPSGSDTHLQIRRAPRSAATWVDVIEHCQVDSFPHIQWQQGSQHYNLHVSVCYILRLCFDINIASYHLTCVWNHIVEIRWSYDHLSPQ